MSRSPRAAAAARQMIHLPSLLSASIDLAQRAGGIIRTVFESGHLGAIDKAAPTFSSSSSSLSSSSLSSSSAASLSRFSTGSSTHLFSSSTSSFASPSSSLFSIPYAQTLSSTFPLSSSSSPSSFYFSSTSSSLSSPAVHELNDPQTLADLSSQRLIISSLSRAFPSLRLIGEEGEMEDSPKDSVSPSLTLIDHSLFPEHLRELPAEDVVVWVR